jgi:RES domain-containing protein
VLAWRLCRAPLADLIGEGARRYGGRWNSPGRPLVYAASTAALAVLEVRVHLDLLPELLPDDYVVMTIDLGDWETEDVTHMPAVPQAFGDAWLREKRTPVLKVPSAIIPECPNLLLNPSHPAAKQARVMETRRFAFDPRLWLSRDTGAARGQRGDADPTRARSPHHGIGDRFRLIRSSHINGPWC